MARTKGSKNKMKRWPVIGPCADQAHAELYVEAASVRAARKLARESWGADAEVCKPEVVSQDAIETAA